MQPRNESLQIGANQIMDCSYKLGMHIKTIHI